jgi:hypothetical protein
MQLLLPNCENRVLFFSENQISKIQEGRERVLGRGGREIADSR